MPITVGFVSEKGGVGKTTSVYHIAVALNRYHNFRVLVVDTDYQRGGLTCRLVPSMLEGFRIGEIEDNTLYKSYRAIYSGQKDLPTLSVRNVKNGLDLVPSDPRLNTISVDKMPPARNLRDSNRMLLNHLILIGDSLFEINQNYDYVLIDSHPDLHDLERAVICACDFVVSPVKLDQQSSIGVPSTIEAIRDVNADVKEAIAIANKDRTFSETKFLGAIGMMCREYGESLKYSEQLIYNRLVRSCGVFENYVTEGDGLRGAAARGTSVYDESGQNADRQSQQFKNVTAELIAKCII